MRKSALLISLLTALAVGAPMAVLAAARIAGDGMARVDTQAFQWGRHDRQQTGGGTGETSSTTTSTRWRRVGVHGPSFAYSPLRISTTGPISATISVNVKGAPVEFRLKDTGRIMRPGKAEFAPQTNDTSRSFTYVRGGDGSEDGCRNLQLEWRSPSGRKVVLDRVALVVTYSRSGSGGCA